MHPAIFSSIFLCILLAQGEGVCPGASAAARVLGPRSQPVSGWTLYLVRGHYRGEILPAPSWSYMPENFGAHRIWMPGDFLDFPLIKDTLNKLLEISWISLNSYWGIGAKVFFFFFFWPDEICPYLACPVEKGNAIHFVLRTMKFFPHLAGGAHLVNFPVWSMWSDWSKDLNVINMRKIFWTWSHHGFGYWTFPHSLFYDLYQNQHAFVLC